MHTVSLATDDTAQLQDLHAWLLRDQPSGLTVRVDSEDSIPGQMGGGLEVILLSALSGGTITAALSVVVSWLKYRAGTVTIKVERDGKKFEYSAERVREMSVDDIEQLIQATASDDSP